MHTVRIITRIQVRGHHPCPSNDIRDQIDVWDVDRGPETEMQQIVACVHGFPQRWYHDIMTAGACAVPVVYILLYRPAMNGPSTAFTS